MGKKTKAEKGGRVIESNEEYTPLLYFSIVSVFVVVFVNNQYKISFIDTFVNQCRRSCRYQKNGGQDTGIATDY